MGESQGRLRCVSCSSSVYDWMLRSFVVGNQFSHSAHPNTNHYLAFLIKDCTLVWWQVPPKSTHGRVNFSSARTSICALYIRIAPLISCWFFQVFHILSFVNLCPDSAGRKLHFRNCCHGPIANQPVMWGKGNTVFQFSVNPKIQL